MLDEIREEAKRLDRSLAWVVQRAWMLARKRMRELPGTSGGSGDDDPQV